MVSSVPIVTCDAIYPASTRWAAFWKRIIEQLHAMS
jgi:hypothetical protein